MKGQSEEKPVLMEEVMEVTDINHPPKVLRISEAHQPQAALVDQAECAQEGRLQFLVIQSIKSASDAFLAEREYVQSNYAQRFGRSLSSDAWRPYLPI